MKLKILSQKYNPLLKRKEVVFEVDHSQEGQTTSRLELRENLANMLKIEIDLVFVEKVETKTGTMIAIGEANAYESAEQAKLIEPEHIITRNVFPKKPAEETEKPKTPKLEEKKPIKEEKLEEGEPEKGEEAKEATSTPKSEDQKEERKKEE